MTDQTPTPESLDEAAKAAGYLAFRADDLGRWGLKLITINAHALDRAKAAEAKLDEESERCRDIQQALNRASNKLAALDSAK